METNKREFLSLAAGVGLAPVILPSRWTKPIIKSLVLPAHAQTSTFFATSSVLEVLPEDGGEVFIAVDPITSLDIGDIKKVELTINSHLIGKVVARNSRSSIEEITVSFAGELAVPIRNVSTIRGPIERVDLPVVLSAFETREVTVNLKNELFSDVTDLIEDFFSSEIIHLRVFRPIGLGITAENARLVSFESSGSIELIVRYFT